MWVVRERADTQILLPDSLPYLPVKEQKELLGGCLQGLSGPGCEVGPKSQVLWDTGKDHCFLSGTEAIVQGTLCHVLAGMV